MLFLKKKSSKSVDLVLNRQILPVYGWCGFCEVLPEGSRKTPLLLCLSETEDFLGIFGPVQQITLRIRKGCPRNTSRWFRLRLLRVKDTWRWSPAWHGYRGWVFYSRSVPALNRLVHELGVRSPKPGMVLDLGIRVLSVKM